MLSTYALTVVLLTLVLLFGRPSAPKFACTLVSIFSPRRFHCLAPTQWIFGYRRENLVGSVPEGSVPLFKEADLRSSGSLFVQSNGTTTQHVSEVVSEG